MSPVACTPGLCFEQGVAVLVAYRIYRGPKKQYGLIPGVLGRSEFGLEIVVTIAYLVYVAGLSFDKVCFLIGFFQNLNLSKSQADALLRQLSYHWREEFDILCTLLANSLVVHADETSWSIHSVWTFLSEKVRLLFFGVHKDGATLQAILDPETFKGLVFSDDAPVYAHFTHAQKCWAHLLRKAIKLTLQDPNKESYRKLADELLDIFHEANRLLHDQRFSDAGRQRKVDDLVKKVFALCAAHLCGASARHPGLRSAFAGVGNHAVSVARTVVHLCDGRASGATQRPELTTGWHEQRSRACPTARRPGACHGANQQDACWGTANEYYHKRPGIVAFVFAQIHAEQRD